MVVDEGLVVSPNTSSDDILKRLVVEALDRLPAVDAARLGVAVERGAVTLFGTVDTAEQRAEVLAVVLRVTGVRALADETKLRCRADGMLDAADIARIIGPALDRAMTDPRSSVEAVVHGHSVSLTGTVAHACDRDAAVRTAWYVNGVQSLENHIVVEPA
jgi:osmotically-inducible protein OsmY